jgi:hypothetical protein
MALPGAFFLIQVAGVRLQSANPLPDLLLMALYYALAPGAFFGALGATALAFLGSPAKKIRTLLVGIVIGLVCPLCFFGALIVFLPKNEWTLGWFLFGFIFALTGAFAGFMAGNAVLSEKMVS